MIYSRPDILSRPLFAIALGLLLLNDFFLKYEFSNFVTGKLSDFAGLFLFPYFLSSVRVKWTKSIYIGTAVLFIFWKSPFSQETLDWVRTLEIGFNRVIDYTDLFALIILPFSFLYFQKQLETKKKIGKYLTIPLSVISLFAFWATTLPREKVPINMTINEEYVIKMSKADIFKSIHAGHGYSDTLAKNLSDSVFYLHFDIIDINRVNITAHSTIISIDTNKTQLRLNKILHGFITGGLFSGVDKEDVENLKSISAEKFKTYFHTYFIKPIENGKAEYIYYDNKEIYDFYNTE